MNKPRDRVRAALCRCKQTERHDMPSGSPPNFRVLNVFRYDYGIKLPRQVQLSAKFT